MLGQQRPDRRGDVFPPVIGHRDVDRHTGHPTRTPDSAADPAPRVITEQRRIVEQVQPPTPGIGELAHHLSDHLGQSTDIIGIAPQVVRRQGPQRDGADPGHLTPGQQFVYTLPSAPVGGGRMSVMPACPPTVAVHDHGDMPG